MLNSYVFSSSMTGSGQTKSSSNCEILVIVPPSSIADNKGARDTTFPEMTFSIFCALRRCKEWPSISEPSEICSTINLDENIMFWSFKEFSFSNIWLWAYLMKDIPNKNASSALNYRYLRFYSYLNIITNCHLVCTWIFFLASSSKL